MSPESRPVCIVVIEGLERDAWLIERAIRGTGASNEVVAFRTGAEALTWLFGDDGSGGRPLLIVLGLSLPDMAGADLLGQLKANPHTRPAQVVVLTTIEDTEGIRRSYDLGASVCITEPVDDPGFVEAIRLGLFLSVIEAPELD